jgi:uncharacterized membrane-anchored protein YjiN (DUF445 family)
MRIIATGMLVAMAVLFLVAGELDDRYAGWGYVRAFAEAAMVGGLADWFAVTALFRHPLGLPIPHTAIIPKNKDRIGTTLAQFLKDNFLTPSVVARRMRGLDIAGVAGKFLTNPPGEEGRLREGASRLFADVLEALDKERLGGMVKGAIASRLRGIEVAPLLGQTLEAAITEDRHVPLLDGLIVWLGRTLDANEDMIRKLVQQRANWIMKMAGPGRADRHLHHRRPAQAFDRDGDRPDHPVRLKAQEGMVDLAARLQHDPELRAKVEEMKNEIIGNRAVAAWIDGLWERTRAGLLNAARNPEATMAGKFGEAIRQLGATLQQDARPQGHDQPVRPPRRGRRRRQLWRRHRYSGFRHDPQLGRAHRHQPPGECGRRGPSVYPDQRYSGRGRRGPAHPHGRSAGLNPPSFLLEKAYFASSRFATSARPPWSSITSQS